MVLGRGSKAIAELRAYGYVCLVVGAVVWAVEWWNHGLTYAARCGVGFWFLACGFVMVEVPSLIVRFGGEYGDGDRD